MILLSKLKKKLNLSHGIPRFVGLFAILVKHFFDEPKFIVTAANLRWEKTVVTWNLVHP